MQANAGSRRVSTKPQIDTAGAPPRPPQILRLKEVMAIVGLGRSAIYNMRAAGTFPKPVRLGARAVGWIAEDVVAWIAQRADVDYVSQPPADLSNQVGGPLHPSSAPQLEGKDRLGGSLARQEYEELQRLRTLELRVRRLQAELTALLGACAVT